MPVCKKRRVRENKTSTERQEIRVKNKIGFIGRVVMAVVVAIVSYLLLATVPAAHAQVIQVEDTGGASNLIAAEVDSFKTNHNASYQVTLDIADSPSGPNPSLEPGSLIVFTFPDAYDIPESISSSYVTINGESVANVDVVNDGDDVAIEVEVQREINDEEIDVRILRQAGVFNPAIADEYRVDVVTDDYGQRGDLEGYFEVDIIQNDSQVSQPGVSPGPSVEFFRASYTITFELGAGGRMQSGDNFYVDLPGGVTVPEGSISGVRVNGTSASAYGGSNNMVTISSPNSFENGDAVEIEFRRSSGLENPSQGDYTLEVSTDAELDPKESSEFSISDPDDLSFSDVDLSDTEANATSAYEIEFFTGDPGELTGGEDYIIFDFPLTTSIPTALSTSQVTITADGFQNNPESVSVSDQEVRMVVPFDIDSQEEVKVEFSSSAGIRNSSESGNYQLVAKTERQDGVTINEESESNDYSITSATTTLENIQVSPNPVDEQETAEYIISFNVGSRGRIVGGFNTVSIIFPDGTDISNPGTITMDGSDGTSGTVDESSVVIDGQQITFTVPDNVYVNNNGSAEVIIEGIQNPDDGLYNAEINTSAETDYQLSSTYQIGGTAISVDNVDVTPANVNETSEYTIGFGTEGGGEMFPGGSRTLTIRFPSGTTLPENIGVGDVDVVTDGSLESVSVDQENREVQLGLDEPGGGGQPGTIAYSVTEVRFDENANVTNPTVPGADYFLQAWTSEDPNPQSSENYVLNSQSSAPNLTDVSVSPTNQGFDGAVYEFNFEPGQFGRLIGGTSFGSNEIEIQFPGGYDLPESISANEVEVESQASQDISIDGQVVTVVMPEDLVIEAENTARIRFGSDAGIDNPDAGTYGFALRTDVENDFSDVVNVEIDEESEFTVTGLNPSSQTVNSEFAYSIDFIPGTADNITAGDEIRLDFEENTEIPSSISTNLINVNGVSLQESATRENEQTLVIRTPIDLPSDTEHQININSQAGILAPTLTGSYNITVRLEDGTQDLTPDYELSPTDLTVSRADVELSGGTGEFPDEVNNEGVTYEITFDTDEQGRLMPGESTITVQFPEDTDIADVSGGEINGEEVPAADITLDTEELEVTLTVPEGAEVGNSSTVELEITDVDNPSVEDSYNLQVRTSVESEFVESNSYNISAAGPVEIVDFQLRDSEGNTFDPETTPDTVSSKIRYDIEFFVDVALSVDDNVIIQFPEDVDLPTSIEESTSFEFIVDGDSYPVNPSEISPNERRVYLDLPIGVDGGALGIRVNEEAGIRNPSHPADASEEQYRVRVATTTQPSFASTDYYGIVPSEETSITQPEINISTDDKDVPVEWTWNFTTGSYGALKAGDGRIKLQFESDVSIPDEDDISRSSIQVNGDNSSEVEVNGQELLITISSNTTIGRESGVEVVISESSGIMFSDEVNNQRVVTESEILEEENGNGYSARTTTEPNETSSDGDPVVLPIILDTFEVAALGSEGNPELQWVTTTERENEGFRILRSHEVTEKWKELDFVSGAGTTTEPQKYTYIDESLSRAGQYRYKIVQEDYDGTQTEYGPVEFTFSAPSQYEMASNYPNPFNPVTTIPFKIPESSEVRIDVFNIIGERVQMLVNEQKDAGSYTVDFDGSRLASGIYIVRFQAGGVMKTMEITLVK